MLAHTPTHKDTPTQMYMHKEPAFPEDSATCGMQGAASEPAAFPGLAVLLHPLPPPEDRWKMVLKTTIPKHTSSHQRRDRPGRTASWDL